jgi:DNA modification methylase
MVIQGDCLDILPTLPSESVQMCCTSPPYWGLRDYGVDGQLGLEKTPEEYVANMVKVFQEVKRVLRDDGTLWLNLGDSYGSGSRKTQTAQTVANGNRQDLPIERGKQGFAKQLVGIPWRVAFALQSDGWWLRQDIIWNKPNPMPESVTDRCTKSHEYIFLLTKSAKYFYDAEAIKEPQKECTTERYKYGWDGVDDDGSNGARTGSAYKKMKAGMNMGEAMGGNGMRNKRSVWEITTKPFKEAHFATFPPEIPEICIKAGSRVGDSVLDPFSGAGTTGLVAEELNRNYIGIELNPAYGKITAKRMYGLQPNLIF